ncbi:Crp/Fnr family transcriptional regulator [Chelatococcus asaccharovorans]|uniref:CRP-like cAMP-binding protein n=1 Tax=Chelatococcus asaccharovorans TaxID=28210 RepID=A0A2V3TZC5_9HYPH|nr:Crp/Fnr family transcriptional regulator [Chelatococcus asaccharovorans]MBS7707676.1 Crp/Fnr family transcriptional regulator [Chelatococcus asaccharovorans]PXW55252.1 CRP-like cAMP-binding protein [Chelatococcus asaccharovorans]CAH1657483.1 CRP-like cAMP-binding protein [Chelatococcus asaccharovorans]CAH1687678.1 CRP-like cAMP-binding protein [Chelatococcus asaccharovorans]
MAIMQSGTRNRILALLPHDDFVALAPYLIPISLPKGYLIARKQEEMEHAYFLEAGIGSIVAHSPEGQRAETGLVGREGVLPVAFALDVSVSTHEIIMQVEGHGFIVDSDVLRDILASRPRVRQIMSRFAHAMWIQTAHTALSNAVHTVEERLARWLLMCLDRVDDGEIPLTHEYMAIMLAVRRASVTTALHVLEGKRFVYADRGRVIVRDRKGLEEFAADAYGGPELEYGRLIDSLSSWNVPQSIPA